MNSIHSRNLWSYAEAFLRGEGLSEIGADPTQLGGDLVAGRDGPLLFAYHSREATGGPAVSTLLEAVVSRAGPASPADD